MSHSIIAKGAHGTVEHKGVIVELHQILTFRQLQDVNTPEEQTQKHPDANWVLDSCKADVAVVLTDLFSSGMCKAIMMRGSVHSTTQPNLSLTLPTSGLRKRLGMRLQMTGVSIWTSSLGGH